MDETRRHVRLKESIDVTWRIEAQHVSGTGVLINISSSGFLLQTDRLFRPSDDCILSIKPVSPSLSFAPKRGKIKWLKRIHTPKDRYQCGVEFLPDAMDRDFQGWLNTKVEELGQIQNMNILSNLVR